MDHTHPQFIKCVNLQILKDISEKEYFVLSFCNSNRLSLTELRVLLKGMRQNIYRTVMSD